MSGESSPALKPRQKIGAKLAGTGIEIVAHLPQAVDVKVNGPGAFPAQGSADDLDLGRVAASPNHQPST